MALIGHESVAISHRYTHVGEEALQRATLIAGILIWTSIFLGAIGPRHCGIFYPSKSAQIRDDRLEAFGNQRANHAIPSPRVVRKAMQKNDRITVGWTAFFVTDLQRVDDDCFYQCLAAHIV
jgi:hypothetical protein